MVTVKSWGERSHGAALMALPPVLVLARDPGEVDRRGLQQPGRSGGQGHRQRPQLMWNGGNASRNAKPGTRLGMADCVQLRRLCGKALWRMEIKETKWRFFMACQLFSSKGHFNCNGGSE